MIDSSSCEVQFSNLIFSGGREEESRKRPLKELRTFIFEIYLCNPEIDKSIIY